MKKTNTLTEVQMHKVLEIRDLTKSTYVLRMERNKLEFIPGQYISIGKAKTIDKRDYSIYSSPDADYLEVLIREVRDGMVSKDLRKLNPGDELELEGPFGFFQLKKDEIKNRKFYFIASGTGVSPFHSMVQSYPKMNYTLLHGVRYAEEAYEKEHFSKGNYVLSASREGKGNFYGRVTDYLNSNQVPKDCMFYLCGNCDMINDVFDILEEQGVPSENIHAEVYF
jgi:ferredoxin/flavodoxin---NADP+ reductase